MKLGGILFLAFVASIVTTVLGYTPEIVPIILGSVWLALVVLALACFAFVAAAQVKKERDLTQSVRRMRNRTLN